MIGKYHLVGALQDQWVLTLIWTFMLNILHQNKFISVEELLMITDSCSAPNKTLSQLPTWDNIHPVTIHNIFMCARTANNKIYPCVWHGPTCLLALLTCRPWQAPDVMNEGSCPLTVHLLTSSLHGLAYTQGDCISILVLTSDHSSRVIVSQLLVIVILSPWWLREKEDIDSCWWWQWCFVKSNGFHKESAWNRGIHENEAFGARSRRWFHKKLCV